MSDSMSAALAALPPDRVRAFEEVCNRFETAWKAGTPPRIEDFLEGWMEPERLVLLRELVLLDVDYRRQRGVTSDEPYRRLKGFDPAWLKEEPVLTGAFEQTPASMPIDPVATPAGPHQIAPGMVIGGRYTLQEKIGTGGMGEVWVAKQTQPVKRKVALKLIKIGMDSRAVLARFEQERQALALMDHPNIARVLDGGLTPSGQPFFVMELVNGLPLTKFCDEARLTPRERLDLFVPICHAVQHAHQKGIVHRDLKPSNILVTLLDGKPIPRVIDFGLAKAVGGKLTDESVSTQFGTVVGTLEYMSPEQAGYSSVDVDTRSDIYSLGIILYELLTGLRPVDGKRVRNAAFLEMIRILKEEEPSKPSTRLSSDESLPSLAALRQTEPRKLLAMLRGELDWVVMKCLEKTRDRRYETANGLARDVQRYLADEAVEARPPSVGYQLQKFMQRHRGAVLAGSLLLATLVVGIVGTTWGLLRANAAASAERSARAEAEQAEVAEKEAREKAEMRLTQVDKGNAILAGIFHDLDPKSEEKKGLPLRVLLGQRLEAAVQQLDGEAVGDPVTVARLQSRLGQSLMELANYAQAEVVLKKALGTQLAALEHDHLDALTTKRNLAWLYQEQGRYAEAETLTREVLQGRTARLGVDHPETLSAKTNHAWIHIHRGKYAEAETMLREVIAVQIPILTRPRSGKRSWMRQERPIERPRPYRKSSLDPGNGSPGAWPDRITS